MKMCLAPCYKGCSDERYAEESAAVENFFATRGESRLVTLRTQREKAAADLEFETAAAIHAQVQRVEGVRALAAELVRPMSRLRGVVLQPAADPGEVSVFLYEHGSMRGPAAFSTVGMRIQNEQSGSSSLFAQPMAMEPVVEEQGSGVRDQGSEEQGPGTRESGTKAAAKAHRTMLEARLEEVLAALSAKQDAPSTTARQGHLALLKRWYYRPEAKRTGEIFFPDDEDHWQIRPILRGVGRVAAKSLTESSGS
jgi:excinuclease UvrABC nuclease subunit